MSASAIRYGALPLPPESRADSFCRHFGIGDTYIGEQVNTRASISAFDNQCGSKHLGDLIAMVRSGLSAVIGLGRSSRCRAAHFPHLGGGARRGRVFEHHRPPSIETSLAAAHDGIAIIDLPSRIRRHQRISSDAIDSETYEKHAVGPACGQRSRDFQRQMYCRVSRSSALIWIERIVRPWRRIRST